MFHLLLKEVTARAVCGTLPAIFNISMCGCRQGKTVLFYSFDIDCGSNTFSAKALSKLNIGIAITANGETGSYSIVRSTVQPFSELFLLFPSLLSPIENIIRHLLATLLRPFAEKKTKSPLDTSDFSHTQHTLKGIIGGRPNISSTSSPTASGLSTGLPRSVDGLTECDDATILGQFVGVDKKACIFSRETPGTFVLVVNCSEVTADERRSRDMKQRKTPMMHATDLMNKKNSCQIYANLDDG
uniref:Uncharacterized protein n=1 Tax=Ditylum brightwellii TaxID=49249 RepID=A0A6U4ABV6_9STRA|mmetsp:Transcript_24618/g.36703  ORF Transcript_24618/g.36703 Transcript_24618/m.36703 type:complete len:243 (+) Transcript_24618:272-1000(+)